jgi:hypothetical protein
VPGRGQLGQGGHGEIRGAEEGDAHGGGLAVAGAARNPLSTAAVCQNTGQEARPGSQTMRLTIITGLAVAAVAVSACGKDSEADQHLKAAGQEAKAAASDVGKAIDSATPGVKQAGRDIGEGIKRAGDEAAPSIKEAGRSLGRAAHDAGEQIKESGDKAKQDTKKDDDKN